jgi:hypothetical protein
MFKTNRLVYLHLYYKKIITAENALFIKQLRIGQQLCFDQLYQNLIKTYPEFEIITNNELANQNIVKGHAVCSVAMFYLDDMNLIDLWFNNESIKKADSEDIT